MYTLFIISISIFYNARQPYTHAHSFPYIVYKEFNCAHSQIFACKYTVKNCYLIYIPNIYSLCRCNIHVMIYFIEKGQSLICMIVDNLTNYLVFIYSITLQLGDRKKYQGIRINSFNFLYSFFKWE